MLGNPAYPTYQSFIAFGIAALVALVLMPLWIRVLKYEHIGQQVRADGPQRHHHQAGHAHHGRGGDPHRHRGVEPHHGQAHLGAHPRARGDARHGRPRPHRRRHERDARPLARPHAARQDDRPHAHLRRVLLGGRQPLRGGARGALPGRLRHRPRRPYHHAHDRRRRGPDPVALRRVHLASHRGPLQRRQPDGRPRRPRGRHVHDRDAHHGRHLVSARRRQTSPSSARPARAPASASSGSTAIRRASSWATRARSRSAPRSPALPS